MDHAEESLRTKAIHQAYELVHQRICSAMDAASDGPVSRQDDGLHRWLVKGDKRQIQTAVMGGAALEEPLMLPLEAIELDAFRQRHEHDTFWCGLLLGGCSVHWRRSSTPTGSATSPKDVRVPTGAASSPEKPGLRPADRRKGDVGG
ncbi:hypothetical protein [Streptomyces sp. NBC_00105]|uniref:hypothetical protein n=1 Tax=Streptomyces sp. NBC_00105 TaxID=2903622 RepID=UPI0032505B7B